MDVCSCLSLMMGARDPLSVHVDLVILNKLHVFFPGLSVTSQLSTNTCRTLGSACTVCLGSAQTTSTSPDILSKEGRLHIKSCHVGQPITSVCADLGLPHFVKYFFVLEATLFNKM